MHPDHGIDRDHGGPRSDLNERPAPRLFATGCQGSASGRRRAILPDPRHHPDLIRCPATPGPTWRAAASPHRRRSDTPGRFAAPWPSVTGISSRRRANPLGSHDEHHPPPGGRHPSAMPPRALSPCRRNAVDRLAHHGSGTDRRPPRRNRAALAPHACRMPRR